MKKLLDDTCDLALFSHAAEHKDLLSFPLKKEYLFAMIPENHPLASEKIVRFSQINGEAVIPFPLKGYWSTLLEKKLPDSQFLYQANIEAFDKIINSSNLISFASDMLPADNPHHKYIPVMDQEAEITYHFVVVKSKEKYYQRLIKLVCEKFRA